MEKNSRRLLSKIGHTYIGLPGYPGSLERRELNNVKAHSLDLGQTHTEELGVHHTGLMTSKKTRNCAMDCTLAPLVLRTGTNHR